MPIPRFSQLGAGDQGADGGVHDHRGARQDQHPLGGRGGVLELLVAVAVARVRRLLGAAHGEERDQARQQVDAGVQRLGQDRHRPGQDPGGDLERDQERVRDDRDRGGAAASAAVRLRGRQRVLSHANSSRAAWPRWEIASFSSSVSSAIVRPGVSSATNNGSYPKPPSPRGRLGERALADALEQGLLTVGRDVCDHAHVPRAAAGRRLAVQLVEVLAVGGVLAGEAGRPDPGRPAECLRLDPAVVGEGRAPGRLRRRPRLDQRVFGVGVPRLLRAGMLLGQRIERHAGQQPGELAQLVIVAGREQQPHRRAVLSATGRVAVSRPVASPHRSAASCASRRPSMPICASASNSSRCVRDSGVRSAVAWTSTSPPSPVITTFASTSAPESSG